MAGLELCGEEGLYTSDQMFTDQRRLWDFSGIRHVRSRVLGSMLTAEDYYIPTILVFRLYDAFTQVHQTNWTDFHGNANVSHMVYQTLTSSDACSFSHGIGGLCGFTPRRWRTSAGILDLPRK